MVVIISKRVQKPNVIVMYVIMDIQEDFNLVGLRRTKREVPILQGGDESGVLCPRFCLPITI
jgi:hypothetical protein